MRVHFGKFSFVVKSLDDICILSIPCDKHVGYLAFLFDVLRKEKLFAHIDQRKFARKEVSFLGTLFLKKDCPLLIQRQSFFKNQLKNRSYGYRRDRANVNHFENESVKEETIATASNEAITILI